MVLLVVLSVLLALPTQASDPDLAVGASGLRWEFDVPAERVEFRKRRAELEEGFRRINDYWQSSPERPIRILIKRFESNPNFQNCAKLQNRNEIYLHSLASLKGLSEEIRSKINPVCFAGDYDDFFRVVLHEYAHALDLQNLLTQVPAEFRGKRGMKWIWEGLAGHLSEQLDYPLLQQAAIKAVQQMILPLNVCAHDFSAAEAYTLGAAVVRLFEFREAGITKYLRAAHTPAALRDLLKARRLTCMVTPQELMSVLAR